MFSELWNHGKRKSHFEGPESRRKVEAANVIQTWFRRWQCDPTPFTSRAKVLVHTLREADKLEQEQTTMIAANKAADAMLKTWRLSTAGHRTAQHVARKRKMDKLKKTAAAIGKMALLRRQVAQTFDVPSAKPGASIFVDFVTK